MEKLLTHTLSIENHPLCELKEKFRLEYVMGLGEFMHYISRKDKQAKLVFEAWAKSIVTKLPLDCWSSTDDYKKIRDAITLKRDGLRFFLMRRIFFFDCLYICSILDAKLLKTAYNFLYKHVGNFIARKVLDDIYTNWHSNKINKVPLQLLNHRSINNKFQKKPLKKILVVATMNAGKSTLINALIGYKVNAVKTTACTNKLCYIYNKPCYDGIIIRDENGGLHYNNDKIDILENSNFIEAGLHFNSSLADSKICFIDTPGVNNSDDVTHGEITRKAIDNNDYDAILYVENCQQFNTDDDAKLREYTITHTKKPIIFVLNQLDCFHPLHDSIQATINNLYASIDKISAPIVVPLSAYYSLLLRIGEKQHDEYETIQYEHLKYLFHHDYYNMTRYVRNSRLNCQITNEIDKTGVTILEHFIKKI